MFKFESFLIGVFLLFSLSAHSSTFTCPVPEIFQGLSCDGSVEVKTLSDLIAYKNNLAQNKGRGKNLIIGFDVSTNTLTISTPCKITIAEKRGITSTADICLHAGLGINFSDSSDLHAKNVRLESNNNIILENHADVKVDNLEMVSLGNTNDSRIHIKENAKVDAKNLLLEAFDRVSLGANSTYKIVENVKLYSRGDDDASVGANTQVSAATFELMAYDQARIANNVSIKADTAIINGKSCSIINKTTTITATNKLGSCFLQSDVKNNFFTVDTNNGFAPLQVTFNASKVKSSSYIFSFGNGDTVTTTSAITKYTYNRSGNFTATLNYLEGKNYKSAGGVQITVKEKPVLPPVASLICSTNNLLANCNALASYDMQGLPLIFTFNYADGFSETNLTGLSSHAYILPGLYIVKLTVSNSMGLSANMTAQIQPMLPPNVLPSLNLNCSSSKPNSLECDSIGSRDADGSIISFQYNFDDNTSDTRADTSKVTHAFLSGGSHLVKLTGVDNDGGVSVVEKSFTVKENTNPVADFNCVSIKPYQVSCNSTSTDIDVAAGNDSLTSYSWNIQNQTITLAANTTLDYNFHSGGEFIVSLTVKDSYGGVGFVSKTISVKENLAPLANFTCANTGVRSIHCISSSSDSDGLIASTSWVLDDGTSLTGISFDYMFLNDQAHTINLLVTDDLGASTSAIQTVHPIQNQPPQGDISASTLSGVVPLTVNFSSQNVLDADGTVTSIAWSFSDGGQSTGATTTHTFNNVGAFTASMILTDNLGTVTTKNVVITTLEPLKEIPGVALKYFENGSTQVDLRSTLTKTQFDLDHAFYTIDGTTTVPILEFYAGTRTLVDLKTYGTHSVTLTVVDIRGQSATTTSVINLLQDPALLKPVVDFRVIQSSVKTAFFNFNRSFNPDVIFGIKNFHIEYGDGASADISTDTFATHTYLAAGTYTAVLTITATQGTKSSLSKTFTITNTDVPIVQPVAAFSYQINSFAQNVSFYNEKSGTPNGSIISYLWDFGDGTSGTGDRLAHFYDPGSYIVTLTVTDSAGLRSSQTQHIIISQTGSDLALNIDCGTATTQIQNCNITALDKFNEINSVRVLWGDDTGQTLTNLVIPGQGIYRVSKKYLTPGLKNISLYVSTVRGDVGTQSITKNIIFPNPIAQIGCNTYGLVLDCWASGSYDPSGGVIKSYTFDPGNGDVGINTTGNFHYVYQQAGSYNVSVKVINTVDLFAVANIQVNVVNLPPIASINCSVNNLMVICNSGGSYDPEGRPLRFKFDYGDGYIEENNYGFTSHAYSEVGLRTVTLSVTDDAGNVSVATTQVMPLKAPNQLPIAKFNCDLPNPLTIYCVDDGSYDQDGSIVIKKLSFDDGAEDFLNTPTATRHQFTTGGEHIVSLTVIDNDGGVTTLTKSFLVKTNNPPIASFECNTNGPQKLSCYSTSTDPDSGDLVISFDWEFGDGVIKNGLESAFDHTYGVDPVYTVKLAVHDQYGGSSTVQKDVAMIVNQAPVASIDCQNSGLQTITCQSFSYDVDGEITRTHWKSDDGFIYDGNIFTHTFSGGENHKVELTITDDLNKSSTTIQDIQVFLNQLPVFNIGFDKLSGPPPLGVSFKTLNAIDPDGSIVSYKWIFEDGSTSDQPNVDHTFSNIGVYNVKLQVTDNVGGMAEETVVVNVAEPANVIILTNVTDGVAPLQVHFNGDQSTDPNGDILKYEWFYNGEVISTNPIFDWVFDTVGEHYVELRISNSLGMITSSVQKITTSQPAIYLDGVILKKIFSNREMRIHFNLESTTSIPKENVQILIESNPSGVYFDQFKSDLVWIPDSSQAGSYEFKIIATDGIIYSYRVVRLNVIAGKITASVSIAAAGGTFTINNPASALNGTLLTLPSSLQDYVLSIVEGGEPGRTSFMFESSIDLNSSILMDYQVPKGIEISTLLSSDLSDRADKSSSNLKLTNYTADHDEQCTNSIKTISQKTDYNQGLKINNVQFWYDKTDPRSAQIAKSPSLMSNVMRNTSKNLNIYLGNRVYPAGGSLAAVPFFQSNTIFYNNNKFLENSVYNKYVLTHEYYHTIQNSLAGCGSKIKSFTRNHLKTKSIIEESTADYFSMKNLNDEGLSRSDSIVIVQKEYGNSPNEDVSIFFKNIFSGGVFNLNLTETDFVDFQTANALRPYRNRLFFEETAYKASDDTTPSIHYDFDAFYKYYIANYPKYKDVADNESSKSIFIDFGKSTGQDFKYLLLGIGRDLLEGSAFRIADELDEETLDQFKGTYYLRDLKNPTLYSQWTNITSSSQQTLLTGTSRSTVVNFSLSTSPLYTDVKRINYGSGNLFSYAFPFKFKYQAFPGFALELYSKDIFGVDMAFQKSYQTNTDGITYNNIVVNSNPFDVGPMAIGHPFQSITPLYDHLVDADKLAKRYDGKFEIYYSNSSSDNLNVNVSILPLCRKFNRDVSKPLLLTCKNSETKALEHCWVKTKVVVYFCPANTTDVISQCFQSYASYAGADSSWLFRESDTIGSYPLVFACQNDKSNNSDSLDFELSDYTN